MISCVSISTLLCTLVSPLLQYRQAASSAPNDVSKQSIDDVSQIWHIEGMPTEKAPKSRFSVTEKRRTLSDEEERLFGDWTRPKTARYGSRRLTRVTDAWLEVEIDEDWCAAFRLVPYAGQPVVAEVRIFPADHWPGRKPGRWRAHVLGVLSRGLDRLWRREDREASEDTRFPSIGQGVSAQLLRAVPFRVVQQYARDFDKFAVGHVDEDGMTRLVSGGGLELAAAGFSPRHAVSPSRGASGGWPDRRYAEIAQAYVQRVKGGSRSPNADVGELFGLSVSQVSDALHRCRYKFGILTKPVKRGKPGGLLTPYGKQLLQEVSEGDRQEGGK